MSLGKIIRSWLASIFFGDEPEGDDISPVRSARDGEDQTGRPRTKRKRAAPRRRREPQLEVDEELEDTAPRVRRRRKKAGSDEAPAVDGSEDDDQS